MAVAIGEHEDPLREGLRWIPVEEACSHYHCHELAVHIFLWQCESDLAISFVLADTDVEEDDHEEAVHEAQVALAPVALSKVL